VSKLKKIRPHYTFSHILCLLLSHLAHSDEDPNNQQIKRLKTPHKLCLEEDRSTKVEDRLPTYLGGNVISYLTSPCFFFLRISRRDSV
jgi:hypothetical protein